MGGVNQIDVAGSMQRLVWLATATRPNEDKTKPFTPQCSSWKHFIASRYSSHEGTEGSDFQNILEYAVPDYSTWIICHVGIQSAPVSIGDENLGETPFNYGDYRSETSINPYGDYGIVGAAYPQLQWVNQNNEAITPIVPSFAMQGQQVLIPVAGGNTGKLLANFAFQQNDNILKVFVAVWGWLVPPQVGGRLVDFSTTWFVQA